MGGVSLPLPDQVVEPVEARGAGHGDYRLRYESPVVSEGWNAQISLLAGMEAARIMLEGGTGLLRTLPPSDERTRARLRHSAKALGVAWPTGPALAAGAGYPAFVRSLDPATPVGAALLVQAARALRGAGYAGFTGGVLPDQPAHAAVAAPYAHVTAPLRRLCDRAANEVVLALLGGAAVPDWATSELTVLPELMAEARNRERARTPGRRSTWSRLWSCSRRWASGSRPQWSTSTMTMAPVPGAGAAVKAGDVHRAGSRCSCVSRR